jgi:hypothetical protein
MNVAERTRGTGSHVNSRKSVKNVSRLIDFNAGWPFLHYPRK